jgi:glycosyltransferase involved in cell wall biosynthesis
MKVSAIITTFNRYNSLQRSIESVKNQTYPNVEIIVVNDKSTQKQYYKNKRPEGVIWIDVEKSSREAIGFPSPGYSLNVGISRASGDYIAVLDDDDIWMPEKIAVQLSAMLKSRCKISSTEGYMGDSYYNSKKKYPLYHKEFYADYCKDFFNRNYENRTEDLPDEFDLELIRKHNFIIHSSVMYEKKILAKTGLYKEDIAFRTGGGQPEDWQDWDLWVRILEHTNCLYIRQPLMYFDGRLSQNFWHKRMLKKINKFFTRSQV